MVSRMRRKARHDGKGGKVKVEDITGTNNKRRGRGWKGGRNKTKNEGKETN